MPALSTLRALLVPALDLAVPVLGYGVLNALGVAHAWALAATGSATALVSVWHGDRRRGVELLGALIVAELVLAAGLTAVTHDARLLLVRTVLHLGVADVVDVAAALALVVGLSVLVRSRVPELTRIVDAEQARAARPDAVAMAVAS
ncbi:MAG: hypothetical protein U0Q15_19130 [Kineosporiaceae bacterium]